MPMVDASDGTPLHYRAVGDGPRAVLMVHGWMVSSAVYAPLLEQLDLTGLKLVLPDLRGTGKSGTPPGEGAYSLEQYARDLWTVVEAAGLERLTLVGHSMGGQLAQWLAAAYPERIDGMVLFNSVPASGLAMPPDAVGLFRTSGKNPEKQRTILQLACKQLSPEAMEALLADAGTISEACIQNCFDSWTGARFAERLAAIAAPTLVVATDDPFLPPDFLREVQVKPIRRARLAHLPGPGHYPQVERPRETAALLTAFIAGLPAAS